MNDARWELDVAPTVRETYEGMIAVGRGSLSGKQRATLIFQSVFIVFFAALGATMILLVTVQMSTGREFSDLPVFVMPVIHVIFAFFTFWLLRWPYMKAAEATVKSRFGRAQQVILDPSGIAITTAHSRWQSGWADVEAVQGSKAVLAVGMSGIAIVLPRRAFLGPLDANDALEHMRNWQSAGR